MGDLTKNFSAWEFSCHHCGKRGVNLRLVHQLQRLRDYYGVRIDVVSGYRCAEHPIEKKKERLGFHAMGLAADITVHDEKPKDVVRVVLKRFPQFRGVGFNAAGGTVHVDIRPWAEVAKWMYDAGGKWIKWNETLLQELA